MSGQDLDFQIFEVLPEKGLNAALTSGTTIRIPANSLKSIPGERVQVKVREFQDKSSAFLAGIPMDYQSNSAFESAGMIEVRAEKEGKSVSLSDNLPMEVHMALYESPEGFKFWKLDEENREWKETPCKMTSNNSTTINGQLKKVESQIEVKKEKIEICEKEILKYPVAIKSKSVIESLIPAENSRKLIIEFNQRDYPELIGYKDIEFEYILPKNQSEANMFDYSKRTSYAQSQTWHDVDIKKQSDYYIATFSNADEKYSLPIRPVLKGKSLSQMEQKMSDASNEKNLVVKKLREEKKKAERDLVALKKEQERLITELKEQLRKSALVTRAMERQVAVNRTKIDANNTAIQMGTANFKTTSFGVFNCDNPIPYPPELPSFLSFETQEGTKIQLEAAFVFDKRKGARYSFGNYYQHKTDDIGWFNHESTLVIIDDKGDVFYKRLVNEHTKNKQILILESLDSKKVTLDNIQSILGEANITV
jgi:hypothetical protein